MPDMDKYDWAMLVKTIPAIRDWQIQCGGPGEAATRWNKLIKYAEAKVKELEE